MNTITITKARNNIKMIIDRVKYKGEIFAIGRRNSIDALIIQFPKDYNKKINEITNINTNSKSFDFLENEPEIYNLNDLKKIYV